jgi:hypothetical protein
MKHAPCLSLVLVASALACAFGCAKKPDPQSKAERRAAIDLANALNGDTGLSLTANPAPVHALDVYQLSVPLGAVSRSHEFWKRVDESSVDVATYDLLQKNGFRVGVAPASEWAYFRAIIEQHPAVTKRMTVTSGGAGSIELEMKKNVDFQNLFYLTDDNTLVGRTYERCENLISVGFQPAPRRPGKVRMTMCPLVRSTVRKLQVSVTNDEREYEYVKPERLYDLNLCADIPMDGFLVVAPSTLAKWSSNLGETFLVDGGTTEKVEHVLLMVPRNTRIRHVGGMD